MQQTQRPAADKAAAQKEAEKNSPLLSALELEALPALATGKQEIKECIERGTRTYTNFTAKECEGHVLLVEVTKEFFAAHEKAVFVLKASGNLHVGPGGEVVN